MLSNVMLVISQNIRLSYDIIDVQYTKKTLHGIVNFISCYHFGSNIYLYGTTTQKISRRRNILQMICTYKVHISNFPAEYRTFHTLYADG